MRVEFRMAETPKRPAHHIADVTLVFDAEDGAVAGLVISNWAVWGRRDGLPGISITAPSVQRKLEDGGVRFIPVVRSDRGSTAVTELRRRILAELCAKHAELVTKFGGFLVDESDADASPAA